MDCTVIKHEKTEDLLQVRTETFETLTRCWQEQKSSLQWQCLFVLPSWLKVWWDAFKPEGEQCILSVRQGAELAGIAPLLLHGRTARLMGSPDVCDWLDVIIAPGKEPVFCRALLGHLRTLGIRELELVPVREDSAAYTHLAMAAKSAAARVVCAPEDVVLELTLPETWDAFLDMLSTKERHEIRRKFRRLEETGTSCSRMVYGPDAARAAMDTFLELFIQNRPDKASFMDNRMALFFRSLGEALAQAGILKLFFLDFNGRPAAAAMCFDYNGTMYLYNNGYDRVFSHLSVGVLSKVLSIRTSINLQRKTYNFLKGDENYKYRLGGKPLSLYRCRITL